MFWKKKPAAGEPKAKGLSSKEIIINQIERLGPRQVLRYRLAKTFGGGLAVIELNPQYSYQKKAQKYIMSREELIDGKPAGKRNRFFDTDNPKDLAAWIVDRNGLFIGVEEEADNQTKREGQEWLRKHRGKRKGY